MTVVPGISVVEESVFEIDRSAMRVSVSVSVAELLPGVESVVPVGVAIDAVFASEPVAPEATVAVNVYVAVAPTVKLTVSEMLPAPLAPHDAPDDAAHVHVASERDDGSVSVTVAPVTSDGPLFVATTMYVTIWPGTDRKSVV